MLSLTGRFEKHGCKDDIDNGMGDVVEYGHGQHVLVRVRGVSVLGRIVFLLEATFRVRDIGLVSDGRGDVHRFAFILRWFDKPDLGIDMRGFERDWSDCVMDWGVMGWKNCI
jgi:hypothetical protein